MKNKVKIIYKEDKIFPKRLKTIKNCPEKLYTIGNLELLNTECISVVGSRNCSKYGIKMAEQFSRELALKGITIVSGLAIGIDTVAHVSAMETTGRTIVVLGSGLNNIFPMENIDLLHNIIKNGGLAITEYGVEEGAKRENFPKRNRILSGLSHGVLVIEAGYRSGASLTANIAMKQDRRAFCLPCNVDNKYNGTNELILKGVKPVNNVEQIIQGCGIDSTGVLNYKSNNSCANVSEQKSNKNVSEEYKDIYGVLSNEPKHIDKISEELEENVSKITSILTMLELEGLVEQLPGKMFRTI